MDVPVGFYTQVLGLGVTPDLVEFTSQSGVFSSEESPKITQGSLTNFWRSAENFKTGDMMWAVSQGSPLRRVQAGSLQLCGPTCGRSSGGFLGNSQVNSLRAPGCATGLL